MSKQSIHTTNSVKRRHRRAIALTIAVSALFAACISGMEDEGDVEFRDDCDGPEEYIDQNGEEVICVYTEEPGGSGGGGDPCWYFPWLCGGDGGDGGGDAGDGGGEAGGGGDGGYEEPPPPPPPPPCTAANNDCTTAQPCCGSNVCAFGGERDEPWCQPLEASAWLDSCAQMRVGSPVYRNGSVCHHTTAEMFNATCYEVTGTSCVVGYNGDCGSGPYTIRIRDLVQAPYDTCKH
jgi:hypothetical protein